MCRDIFNLLACIMMEDEKLEVNTSECGLCDWFA